MSSSGMKRDSLFGVIPGLVLAFCVSAAAQELGPWRAANSPAVSITGDVAFSDTKLAINFSSFPIARIRDLQPGEVSAVFDADSGAGARGSLYRLSIPAAKKFMHRNSICGSEDTQWVAAFVSRAQFAPCLLFRTNNAGVYARGNRQLYGSVRHISRWPMSAAAYVKKDWTKTRRQFDT